jgi:hypothetical protein
MKEQALKWRWLGELVLIVLAVLAVYGQVLGHGFVSLDDGLYVTSCAHVREGLTWKGFVWAWSNFDAGNYHPLTWLSYMADVSAFGIEPGRMAFENALIHSFNGWLVMRILQMLGCSRIGALLGALAFVLHPLNVESVAWISERKTVLASAFGLGAVFLYLERAQRGARPVSWAVVACYAASLLAKAWFVPLPVLLLVLDVVVLSRLGVAGKWPNGWRVAARRIWPLLREKCAILFLMGCAAVLAIMAQHAVGGMMGLRHASLGFRLENAGVSMVAYLWTFFSPTGLSVFYALPSAYPLGKVLGAILLVFGLVLVAWSCRRRFPEVAGGVLWLGLFLLPVVGVVQVGMQSRADRYMYIPMVGLIWIAVRSVERARAHVGPPVRYALVGMAVVWLGCCGVVAQRQVSIWKNTFLLSLHSMKAVGPVPILVSILACTYLEMEEPEKALPLFRALVQENGPSKTDVMGYAQSLHGVGRVQESIEVCRKLVALDARDYFAHVYLAGWLREVGELERAAEHEEILKTLTPPYGQVPVTGAGSPVK